MRKLTAKSVCKQADALLTPIIKKMYPRCLLCNNPTEVGHHHVHKSKSTILRHNLDNIIPLCNKCHLALHWNESYHASRIVDIKGLAWFRKLEKVKNQIIKADVMWYSKQLGKLRSIYNRL
jgi:5-methylcytosine-specific restriction endonuclease McrA